ncbi:MAG TPA: pitrilysin family protein [Frankiaceae bacterium]|jgi:predicted Zn-dependent peptidase|nr:pitrilysin family protein [Frankiaceae bacterium]
MSVIPAVAAPGALKVPPVQERLLSNGLRVLAVRRASVPVVELRLRIPVGPPDAKGSGAKSGRERAAATLLAETMLAGTETRDRSQLATELQTLGAGLSASIDNDRLALIGSVLAPNLKQLLALLSEVIATASYPKREVSGERERLVAELAIARSQPAVQAREAFLARLYGKHPYAVEIPSPKALEAVTAKELRTLHEHTVSPKGAVLTLVGDLRPAAALDAVEAALGGWSGRAAKALPKLPKHVPGGVTISDRPGAVQTNIRLGGPSLTRTAPNYAALQVANVVFGGYFSSRLVNNIREDKGYTYSPRSSIEHAAVGSRFVVAADVATEVTGPALLEILYELGKVALLPLGEDELAAAKRYAAGTLALSTATSSGLASTLSMLAGSNLGPEYLREHSAALGAVDAEAVAAVAQQFAPTELAAVLLGDASVITESVEAIRPLSSGR